MHLSKIKFGTEENPDHFVTDHMATYYQKDVIPVSFHVHLRQTLCLCLLHCVCHFINVVKASLTVVIIIVSFFVFAIN